MIGRRVLNRAKPPTLLPSTPTWSGPWPWATDSTEVLIASEQQALDLPVISGTLSMMVAVVMQMPLRAYSNGAEVTPTPAILRNPAPAPNRVLADWVGETLRDLVLHGNAVGVLADGTNGWPQAMYPVPHGSWSIDPTTGDYVIGPDRYASRDIWHVARNRRTGELVGRGLIETHGRLIASCVAAEDWASRYYLGGCAPPAVLSHPNSELTQEQALDLKAKLRAATRNREPIVVPMGTSLQALNSDADSAQLNESRRWGSLQLCQALSIPGALLGLDSPSMTYRNITDVAQQWVSTSLMGLLAPIEQQLSAQCLPRGMEARFNTSAVLRPDFAARVDLAVKGLQGRVMTTNESRALIDLPPIEDAEDTAPALTLVPSEEMAQ